MSTYTQLLYQIVFSTKDRVKAITEKKEVRLYRYIWETLTNKKCHVYRIGGVQDHLHIVTHIHPTLAISPLIKDIKVGSHKMIKDEILFPDFTGWQLGYGAFTYSYTAKEDLINYVKNQKIHHNNVSFRDEYRLLLEEHGVEYDEKYLM